MKDFNYLISEAEGYSMGCEKNSAFCNTCFEEVKPSDYCFNCNNCIECCTCKKHE